MSFGRCRHSRRGANPEAAQKRLPSYIFPAAAARNPCSAYYSSAQVFLWQFRVSQLPRAVRRELGYSSGLMQVFVSAERLATSTDGGSAWNLLNSMNDWVNTLSQVPLATARGVTQTGLGGQRMGARPCSALSARPQSG